MMRITMMVVAAVLTVATASGCFCSSCGGGYGGGDTGVETAR